MGEKISGTNGGPLGAMNSGFSLIIRHKTASATAIRDRSIYFFLNPLIHYSPLNVYFFFKIFLKSLQNVKRFGCLCDNPFIRKPYKSPNTKEDYDKSFPEKYLIVAGQRSVLLTFGEFWSFTQKHSDVICTEGKE
jgi:hypothetical protein